MFLHFVSAIRRYDHVLVLVIILPAPFTESPPGKMATTRRRRDPMGWLAGGWWSGPGGEQSLTPPRWRNRLPFFAKVREDGSPEMRGDTGES
jgi:hypothetical protein